MTITYYQMPKTRVTFGTTVTDGLISAVVFKEENKYWTAVLTFSNTPSIYPSPAYNGVSVLVEVQDGAVGGAWTTLFGGSVLFSKYSFGDSTKINFQCVGYGYALAMMNVAEEYGAQSRNPARDAIQGILTNASVGFIS